MTISGTVVNGAVVPDAGTHLPEGARIQMTFVDTEQIELEMDGWSNPVDSTLPLSHPMAPYNREVEIAIVRESIESVKHGEVGTPLRRAFEELSRKHGLGPLPQE